MDSEGFFVSPDGLHILEVEWNSIVKIWVIIGENGTSYLSPWLRNIVFENWEKLV